MRLLVPFLLCCALVHADMSFVETEGQSIVVDLRDPLYTDGVLTTIQGGVISARDLRIQAQEITYTRKWVEGERIFKVEATGDLMVEINGSTIIGDRLEYDFISQTGKINNARSGMGVWFLQGEEVLLRPDGSFVIKNASVSTCETMEKDWQIRSREIVVDRNYLLSASNVQFMWVSVPIFWLPIYKTSLEQYQESPISYRFEFGGGPGPRARTMYQFYQWEGWRFSLLIDYLIKKGIGGGLEARYISESGLTTFMARHYLANDLNVFIPRDDRRYRHEGYGHTSFCEGDIQVDFQYDKLSDEDMASDYYDRDFNYKSPNTTELQVHRYNENWISGFVTRVRINDFQTVKQELPTVWATVRSLDLGETGIVWENEGSISYLHYRFDDDLPELKSFHSTREEYRSTLYRPLHLWPLTLTPEASLVAIHYNNSPGGDGRAQLIGVFNAEASTHLNRPTETSNQVVRPYLRGTYITRPPHRPMGVYIYDIRDGWDELKMVTMGCETSLLCTRHGFQDRVLGAHLWSHAFIDHPTFGNTIPRLYCNAIWNITSSLSHHIRTAWDFNRQVIDHFNSVLEWTYDEDFAMAFEFRHRREFSWRKVDPENFIVDSFWPEDALRFSRLSDQRNSFLFRLFYRFHPLWELAARSRHGWGRPDPEQKQYHDFDVDLSHRMHCNWIVRISYQHRQSDDRVSFNVDLSDNRPEGRNLYRTHLYR